MENLATQSIKLDIQIANLEVDTAKEEIENELTDAFGNWATSVDEWVLGTSAPRQFAESIIQKYTKGIYEAKDDASLQKANLDFQMAIFNDEKFKDLDNKQKQQIIKTIQQMTSAKKKAIEEQNRSLEKDMEDFKTAGFKENEIVEMLAKKYQKSKDEISSMIKKQEESKKETESQVNAVDKLAEAWGNATAEVDKNMKTQLSAANEIFKQLQNKSLSKEQRIELKSQYDEAIKNLKEQAKEKKNLDRIDELNQIRAGLIVKSGKSALELAKEQAGIKVKSLDLEKQNYEYLLNEEILNENRKKDSFDDLLITQKQLETIQKQRLAWVEVLKSRNLINEITPEGEIIFNTKIKEADKQEIKSIIQDLNQKIQDEKSKIQDLKIKLQIDDIELQDKIKDLEQKKIEWEVSIGIKDKVIYDNFLDDYNSKLDLVRSEITTSNNEIINLYEKLNEELSKISGENAEQERERIRIQYSLKIKELKEHNFQLQQSEFETQQKIQSLEDSIYTSRLESIKKFEEEKLQAIEVKYQQEEELLKRFSDIYNNAYQKKTDSENTDALKKIETEEKAKITELEKWRNMESISAEEYENRKAQIEEEGRKKREQQEEEFRRKQLRIESQRQGLEVELQRKKDKESLTIQKNALKDQLKLLSEKATKFDELGKPIFDSKKDQEDYNALAKKLEETENIISQKGDSLGLVVAELQTTVTDSLTNLFAGDPEAAADSWRKFFAQLAGMLQAKASAFILDLILSPGTMEYLSALPFPANVLAVPVISGVVYTPVKAITDPVISAILSFSSGGRIDEPTLALIGDASNLGVRNREWIFRDDQLIATVQMASVGANSQLLAEIRGMKALLAGQELKTTLRGSDIDISLKRNIIMRNKRVR